MYHQRWQHMYIFLSLIILSYICFGGITTGGAGTPVSVYRGNDPAAGEADRIAMWNIYLIKDIPTITVVGKCSIYISSEDMGLGHVADLHSGTYCFKHLLPIDGPSPYNTYKFTQYMLAPEGIGLSGMFPDKYYDSNDNPVKFPLACDLKL